MSSNFLLVVTEAEEPKVFLFQNQEHRELRELLKNEPALHQRRGSLFTLTPHPMQQGAPSGSIRLQQMIGLSDNTAEAHFKAALYYADLNGSKDHVEQLEDFHMRVAVELKRAKALKEQLTKPLDVEKQIQSDV